MHNFYRFSPILPILIGGWLWLRRQQRLVLTPDQALKCMHSGPLEGVRRYLREPQLTVSVQAIMRDLGGYRGLYRLWDNAPGLVYICAYGVDRGVVDEVELIEMRAVMAQFKAAARMAALEFAVSRLSPSLKAGQTLVALQCYWEMTLRVYQFAADDAFPISGTALERFL